MIGNIEKALLKENIIKEGNLFDVKNISLLHHINQALELQTFKKYPLHG